MTMVDNHDISRAILFRLLYEGLVEIRYRSHDKDNAIFKIADVLHNLPLQLNTALNQDRNYDAIMEWLNKRAQSQDATDWLAYALDEARKGLEWDQRQEDT